MVTISPPVDQLSHNDMDPEFLRRISLIEASLLKLHPLSVDDFERQWNAYVVDLETAIRANTLSPSTITLATALASNVFKAVQCLTDYESVSEAIILSHHDSDELLRIPSPAFDPLQSPCVGTVPSYLQPSYAWLLSNLHNPYPTVHVRDYIARECGVPRKDVDNWFIDTRKRIGWNSLRQTYFSNKRVEIVDAAKRFFVDDDPRRPLDPIVEYALANIETCAKSLYSTKFSESDLAIKLDTIVNDLTPQLKAEALHQKRMEKHRESYPSPERSPELSPVLPELESNEVDANVPHLTSLTNRKRRRSNADVFENDSDDSIVANGVAKRPKLTTPSPLPQSDISGFRLSPPVASKAEVLRPATPPPPTILPRGIPKRHFSDSNAEDLPKHPHHMPVGLRRQTVSDPLAFQGALFNTSVCDGWFDWNLNERTNPHIEEIGPSSFDIELGDLSDLPCVNQTLELLTDDNTEVHNINTPRNFEVLQSLASDFSNYFNNHGVIDQSSVGFTIPSWPGFELPDHDEEASLRSSFLLVDPSMTAFSFPWEPLDVANLDHSTHNPPRPFPPLSPEPYVVGTGAQFVAPSQEEYLPNLLAQAVTREEKLLQLKNMKEETLRLEIELAIP